MTEHSGTLSETIATIREVKAKFGKRKDDGDVLWKAILVNSIPSDNEVLQTILSTQQESKTLSQQTEDTTAIEGQAAG